MKRWMSGWTNGWKEEKRKHKMGPWQQSLSTVNSTRPGIFSDWLPTVSPLSDILNVLNTFCTINNVFSKVNTQIIFFHFFFFCFLGLHPQHLEVLRLGVKSELYLPACTTVSSTPDPSCVCNLHHSSWQHQMLNPLSRARDWTCVLMDTSWIRYHWATMGTPSLFQCLLSSCLI